MSTNVEEIEKQALELDAAARARLVARLLDSLDAVPHPRIERLWIREAERRVTEIRKGNVELLPARSVLRKAAHVARAKSPSAASRKRSHSTR
jgi:hypothetical protein